MLSHNMLISNKLATKIINPTFCTNTEFTLMVDTVFSTFSSKDLKLGEFLWGQNITSIRTKSFETDNRPSGAPKHNSPFCDTCYMR